MKEDKVNVVEHTYHSPGSHSPQPRWQWDIHLSHLDWCSEENQETLDHHLSQWNLYPPKQRKVRRNTRKWRNYFFQKRISKDRPLFTQYALMQNITKIICLSGFELLSRSSLSVSEGTRMWYRNSSLLTVSIPLIQGAFCQFMEFCSSSRMFCQGKALPLVEENLWIQSMCLLYIKCMTAQK